MSLTLHVIQHGLGKGPGLLFPNGAEELLSSHRRPHHHHTTQLHRISHNAALPLARHFRNGVVRSRSSASGRPALAILRSSLGPPPSSLPLPAPLSRARLHVGWRIARRCGHPLRGGAVVLPAKEGTEKRTTLAGSPAPGSFGELSRSSRFRPALPGSRGHCRTAPCSAPTRRVVGEGCVPSAPGLSLLLVMSVLPLDRLSRLADRRAVEAAAARCCRSTHALPNLIRLVRPQNKLDKQLSSSFRSASLFYPSLRHWSYYEYTHSPPFQSRGSSPRHHCPMP